MSKCEIAKMVHHYGKYQNNSWHQCVKEERIHDWINWCSEDNDEIQQPFLIKALYKVGKEEDYLK